ncbi:hypothetical protein ACFV9C_38625 [Kribbella sp. NPDC059898]|uniref:hypothetical protein n=1 Tax=Kribbella sp. NPDC059898 TaxID=3346995 RepID=UPI00365CE80C
MVRRQVGRLERPPHSGELIRAKEPLAIRVAKLVVRAGIDADMEVVHTYEGTDTIQPLIIGREITGTSAFTEPGA